MSKSNVVVQGFCDDQFSEVREAFEENFHERHEVGASFALTVEGEFVVDLWGGHRDAERQHAWDNDTIVLVYSTTKTMTFICALLLVEQGLLDIDAPVREYWPEFFAGGQDVRVKHVMSHSAGLPGFEEPFSGADQLNWSLCCENLANATPIWEPGSQSGYHGLTQGFLIGELVRRISGKTIGTFFKDEVGLGSKTGADFHIGVDPGDFGRIADLIPPTEPFPWLIAGGEPNEAVDSISVRSDEEEAVEASKAAVALMATPEWRMAEIPAANGHGNARGIVQAQTALANNGSAFGVRLFSEATCRLAGKPLISGVDRILGEEMTFAFGYGIVEGKLLWGGLGGSIAVVDQANRACYAYAMNQMGNQMLFDDRATLLGLAVDKAIAAI
ncbi:MAG: beta-lactamase family protein [Gammaproteobacteria bacterium]|nr:beta-lactamase family protein [Gammaproteobacteria bacterium]